MEITVNIPKNDYVQPTEVRQEVVQAICNHLIKWMDKGATKNGYTISFSDTHEKRAEIYLLLRKDGSTSGISSYNDGLTERCGGKAVRVHTSEMQVVFDVMQQAGYYIYGWSCTDGTRSYNFNRRGHFDGRQANHIQFTDFID